MILLLILCPVLLATAAQTLTIDTQLGTSVEDCFDRTSLGERLPPNSIYRNISELSTRECEKICKQDKQCQSYDYGVGAKGNSTCNLSGLRETDIKMENLAQRHPDYDIYVRRIQCEQSPPSPLQPIFDEQPSANRPVIRPGHFDDGVLQHRPNQERPLNDLQRPVHDEEQRPVHDLKPYESNNRPERPYVNKVPYGRPITNPYDSYYDKPKPAGYYERPEFDRPYKIPIRPEYTDGYGNQNSVLDYERPDDYESLKPEYDRPIGYGSHKPQDIPYRPKPIYDRPTIRPSYNQTYKPVKPDPNDILYFQNHYNYGHHRPRPDYGPSLRPDPHYPSTPNDEINDIYGPKPSRPYQKPKPDFDDYYKLPDKKPQHNYFTKPNKKPYPSQIPKPVHDHGYNRPDLHSQKPAYDPPMYGIQESGPIGPPPEKPYVRPEYERPISSLYRPNYDRPTNDYDIPYRPLTGYQKPDEFIYLNIPDHHKRPHKPAYTSNRPSYGNGVSSGYGTQDSQSSSPIFGSYDDQSSGYDSGASYGSQGSQSYGHGSQAGSSYGSQSDSGYGSPNSHGYSQTSGHNNYGPGSHNDISGYGGQNNHNQYGGSSQSETYHSQNTQSGGYQNTYGNQDFGYGSQFNRPSNTQITQSVNYGTATKPSQSPSYGQNKPIQSGYGDHTDSGYPSQNKPGDSPSYSHDKTTKKPEGIKPVYEYEPDRPVGEVPLYVQRPGGQVVASKPVAVGGVQFSRPGYGSSDAGQDFTACYRRVLAGRRALRSHVRRVLPCERLEDCQKECAEERRFHCESFNYKLDPTFRGKGLCELMTKPIEYFDLKRDFVEDRDYDFYEVDRNSLQPECAVTWHGTPYAHSGYLGGSQSYRPNEDEDDLGYYRRQHQGYNRRGGYDRNSYRNYGEKTNRRWGDQFFVPYQIGVGRSNDDFDSWGQYGGSYGGYNTYYNDRKDYKNSLNYWGLDVDKSDSYLEDNFYGVRPHGLTDLNEFDYQSLGHNSHEHSHSYGYGSKRYGQWNNSGYGGFSHGHAEMVHGESNYYGPNYQHGGQHSHAEENYGSKPAYDCSSRRRAGMSLGSGAIRRSLVVHTVLDCESACFRERAFQCVSYSYRYSKSHGSENCFLSETPYRGLDLASDSGSDVYAMEDRKHCGGSQKPLIESECFLHVRSGKAVTGHTIRAALSVAGLGACEAECIRARGFFCRGFSFRFDAPTIGEDIENCLLTSSPPSTLKELRSAPGHELYARGNYGWGCEPDLNEEPAPSDKQCYLQYDNAARLQSDAARGRARVRDEAECGRACTDAPFRCLSFSYSSKSLPEEDNCLLSEIKLFDLQLGVDYKHSSHDWLFAFDLFNKDCWRKVMRPGFDTDRSEGHSPELPRPLLPPPITEAAPLPPTTLGHPSYPVIHGSHGEYGPSKGHGPPSAHGPPTGYGPPSSHGPHGGYSPPSSHSLYDGYGPHHGYNPPIVHGPPSGYGPPSANVPPSSHIYPSGPGYPSYHEHDHHGHEHGFTSGFSGGFRPSGFLPSPPVPVSGPSGPGIKPPGYLPGPSVPSGPHGSPGNLPSGGGNKDIDDYGDQFPVSWRHYTVSGFPCRRGTACAQNIIAGHWSCEPEGGEVGSWDYCCAPTHRCGYSEGFHKPWCYVGQSTDQWRPCSDKYYPYHQHNTPHPSHGGHREDKPRPGGRPPLRPIDYRPWTEPGLPEHRPSAPDSYLPYQEVHHHHKPDFVPSSPYLSDADRKYWDDLYKNGPQAYYDRDGNPLPGYARVPTASRPHIKYHHTFEPSHSADPHWVPLSSDDETLDPPMPGGFGAPRYWPVAYLHKGPPPNTTYFNFHDNKPTSSTERYHQEVPSINPPNQTPPLDFNRRKTTELPVTNFNNIDNNRNKHRDEKTINNSTGDVITFKNTNQTEITTIKTTPDPKDMKGKVIKINNTNIEVKSKDDERSKEVIDDKIDDLSSASIEVLNLDDAKNQKGEKSSEIKTLEAEEKQIEEIGRLLASRRGGKFVLEKRSQSDLASKNIKIGRNLDEPDLDQFNFGSKFVPVSSSKVERRGIVQKVTKDFVDAVVNNAENKHTDQSLEVSESSYVRPNNHNDIRKAYVNGKIFYDATIVDQDKFITNADINPKEDRNYPKNTRSNASERTPKFIKVDFKEVITENPDLKMTTHTYGQRMTKARIINPIRRGRRNYRKRYNPEEVRKRLLERENSKEVEY